MTDLQEKAMRMALERLESHEYWMDEEAIKALRQALAQPEQEPVAGMFEEKLPDQNPPPWVRHYNACLPTSVKCNAIKYTAPPKREWVGLTKEDMPVGDNPMFDTDEFALGAAWAQAKLKEKNT